MPAVVHTIGSLRSLVLRASQCIVHVAYGVLLAARPDRNRTVAADVHRLLSSGDGPDAADAASEAEVLAVLAALAGEVLASGDEVAMADLSDALGAELLSDHPAADALESVLAMVRTYSLRRKMKRSAPGTAPRRAYDAGSGR